MLLICRAVFYVRQKQHIVFQNWCAKLDIEHFLRTAVTKGIMRDIHQQ